MDDLRRLRRLARDLRVAPSGPAHSQLDPAHTAGFVHEADAGSALQAGIQLLSHYQERLAAQDTYALLVVLQALDAAGKDGAIKHVMSGVNPQGVEVRSFKVPTAEELNHPFLWRFTKELPGRGTIGIFNRSYFEEVLVVRVHRENLDRERLPAEAKAHGVWDRRFGEINDWERQLVENGVHVVKIFLNVSKGEQRRRLIARIDDPAKNWKFSAADLLEREYWDSYQHAFAEVLRHTSTDEAPWYVVPSDHKWYARLAVAAIIVDALAEIDPQFPVLDAEALASLADARVRLEADTP